jgi:hypothetical protein
MSFLKYDDNKAGYKISQARSPFIGLEGRLCGSHMITMIMRITADQVNSSVK